jgi:hypothetical protein
MYDLRRSYISARVKSKNSTKTSQVIPFWNPADLRSSAKLIVTRIVGALHINFVGGGDAVYPLLRKSDDFEIFRNMQRFNYVFSIEAMGS